MTTTTPSWSAQQKAIFAFFATGAGNLVVRARAGTGKTTTVIQGIEVAPETKILLAAFNKRIAQELEAKLTKDGADAKTLHSVGFGFVLANWKGVRVDNDRGMKIAQRVCGLAAPRAAARLVANLVSKAKGIAPFATLLDLENIAEDFDLTPEEDLEMAGFGLKRIISLAQEAMAAAALPNVSEAPSIDFDDMLFVPVRNHWVKGKYQMVVIDECQDMNATQLRLAQDVCKKGGRVVVVGDDRQSIYKFRGADTTAFTRLKKELNAHELGLTITYRCPKKVVALAAQLVPDYEAAASAPEGIVRDIREAALTTDAQPGDFVLSRKNAPLVRFCLAMLRTGKRARIEGRDIGAGLLALVRKFKARDLASLTKKLLEWEGKQVKRAIAAKGGDVEAAAPKVQQVVDTRETIVSLAEGLATVAELEMRIETLFADSGEGQVVFSSVHKAKGLEKERVFLLEESFKRKARGEEVATFSNDVEEVNIRYVAITRAKAELVWVKAKLQEAA